MVLVKKFEILPCFYFLQKTASKMRLAIFYKVKKLFLNLVHDSDCIKKNYKELQAIPSFHGIHRVEFLSMLLILQFHGWNLPLCMKDNLTTHFSPASNLKYYFFLPTLVCSFTKSRKLQVIFMFGQRKGHYWMQCQN